ncbi:MAG: PqqD family protein [Rhodobiaceae bacterium]|nr:PqqD family protein [Rhodobiaceae bacterium]MCC0018167.1 PqqD family protein [Rhodobiaceae bacterium]MCC0051267.1 PqqD family protein [Rhodobiaceae bacterium]MCC0053096.1 PqqD family protein [Rhodobiaceae bacterium]
MFYTVFSTDDCADMQWQSELLEHSWKKVGQQGVLVRLVATRTPDRLPSHKDARCVATRFLDTHSGTGPIRKRPASLMEWAFRDRPEGTVLIVDPDCVFRAPVTQYVAPDFPISQPWHGLEAAEPGDANPFGFGERFAFLKDHCARVDLQADAVTSPTLIHTRDLRKIAARWLQLYYAIMDNSAVQDEPGLREADRLAYLAACAEYGLRHSERDLAVDADGDRESAPDAPLLTYCQPIHDAEGRVLFDKDTYRPWTRVDGGVEARGSSGQDFVATINGFIDARVDEMPQIARNSHPSRYPAVKEGRVLDQTLLELPEKGLSVWLNNTGSAVWELCDGSSTVDGICQTLAQEYEADDEVIFKDVMATLNNLNASGFLVVR